MSEIPHSEQLEQEPEIEITEYLDDYKDQVAKLIFDVYENEMEWHSKSGRPDLNMIPEMYQKNGGNFWVALDDEKVIGTIALFNEGEQRGSMHRFCVDKNFRGKEKGVSNELLSTLLKFATDEGYEKIFLATGENADAANKFYIRNGFKRIESLPKDMAGRSYFVHDKLFYELDLAQLEEEK